MSWLWGGILLALVVVLVIVIWSIRRHRDPSLQIDCDDPIDKLMPSLPGLTLGTAVAGNKVEVLENGAFFDVLIERIRAARHSVHFETFLWKDGAAGPAPGRRADRPRPGRACRCGCCWTPRAPRGPARKSCERMRDAGCRVTFFHKRALRNIGVLNDRDHRKIVIIDGKEAFVGGHCIVDEWLGNAEDGQAFRRRQRRTCTGRSCTACRAPSARTGPARPASCSSATMSFRSSSRPATCESMPCSPSRRTPRPPSRSCTTPPSAWRASASGSRTPISFPSPMPSMLSATP